MTEAGEEGHVAKGNHERNHESKGTIRVFGYIAMGTGGHDR